jgi:hypothetical protein
MPENVGRFGLSTSRVPDDQAVKKFRALRFSNEIYGEMLTDEKSRTYEGYAHCIIKTTEAAVVRTFFEHNQGPLLLGRIGIVAACDSGQGDWFRQTPAGYELFGRLINTSQPAILANHSRALLDFEVNERTLDSTVNPCIPEVSILAILASSEQAAMRLEQLDQELAVAA